MFLIVRLRAFRFSFDHFSSTYGFNNIEETKADFTVREISCSNIRKAQPFFLRVLKKMTPMFFFLQLKLFFFFKPTAQGLALHGLISFRMRQEIHRPSGCLFICFAIWNCHGKCLCNSCIRLPSRPDFAWQTVEKSMGVPGIQSGWTAGWQGVPTLKFMIRQSALGNALEKCNP